jgi:ankyrin repeat protein
MPAQTQSPLAFAFDCIADGSIEKTREILLAHPELINIHTFFAGGTLLHYAAAKSNVEMIELLVQMGFDVNLRGKTYQDSALDSACHNGLLENAQALLQLGAKIQQQHSYNDPVFAAIIGNSPAAIELLAAAGADLAKRYTLESGDNVDSYDFAVLRGASECAATIARLSPRVLQ